jgi:hypothetical protein
MPFAISSTGSSADRALARLAAAAWFVLAPIAALAADGFRVAVFPPVNRSGKPVPLEDVRAALESSLAARGFAPLPQEELEAFFRKHRVRYTGGISSELAGAIGAETGIDGVVLTSVDDWETVEPPRVALTSRWVAAIPEAPVAWMGTSAHHGHEHPGAFGLGLVASHEVLLERASDAIARSLEAVGETVGEGVRSSVPVPFRPGSVTIDPEWAGATAAGRRLRVAVLPFVADTPRREVGEVIASQFVRWLLEAGGMDVLEPGLVREALLEARVIQEDGPSLPQVDALRALLDVDLVVSGRVTDFEPMGSAPGSPFAGFSSRGIDARTRQVVFASFSFGRGDDRAGAFGAGRIRSSITLTSELVRGVVQALEEELRTRRPERAAPEKEPPR